MTAHEARDAEPESTVVLPEPVRARVITAASDVAGRLPTDELPASLRAAARFTPARRPRLAGAALAAAVAADDAFRARVAERVEALVLPLAEALRSGVVPAAADPVEVATVAYLSRPEGWPGIIEAVRAQLAEAELAVRAEQADRQSDRLRSQLERAREDVRLQAQQARADATSSRAELDALRRQLRELSTRIRAAERSAEVAREELAEERRQRAGAESVTQSELRRTRQRLAEATEAAETARRSAREARSTDDTRLWLLLETMTGAVHGLRRELALRPSEERPADSVAAAVDPGSGLPPARGDDPAFLDRLLALPQAHLVIDGYNVTKTGYGDQPLETQRSRLVAGLGVLAAQTGAEVSCVFDGANRPPLMPPSPRGVRVLFSPAGQTADELIRRFVAAEPAGRPVIVVSSDREVADGVRASGAWPVASVALLRRLDRG